MALNSMSMQPAAAQPHRGGQAVGWWLVTCAVLVYAMIALGGVTRLTGSGLSMVRWHPISGAVPPFGEEAWHQEFDAYRASPEYRLVNRGMSLEAFKRIFWMEYAHRLLGRFVGLVFALPLAVFLWRRAISPSLAPKLGAAFLLGAGQGLLGWYMVKSGLVDEPRVSQYRLAAHLALAVAIYVFLVSLALQTFSEPRTRSADPGSPARRVVVLAGAMVLITVIAGAFVAGLKAGYVYPTFPKMGEFWIPPGMFDASPWWRNPFENPVTAQFVHRLLALASVIAVLSAWLMAIRSTSSRRVRCWSHACAVALGVQVALGVLTLLNHVPVALATLHQAGAIALLTCLTVLYHAMPSGRAD